MHAKPHIILTQRRTGGTSLTAFLGEISHFPTCQHEPLNKTRIWKHIGLRYAETGDEAEMRAALAEFLEPRQNIKHCVELCHPAITRELIAQTAARDYQILVLTRRDEVSRQISVALAKLTGAWGPEDVVNIYPQILSGARKLPPLNVPEILRNLDHDMMALARTIIQMRNQGVTSHWLVFEELFKGATPIETQARHIAEQIGVNVAADDKRLARFSEQRGQGSSNIEPYVAGLEKLRQELAARIFT